MIGVLRENGVEGLGPLSVLLSIVGSLSGQLVTQVRGFFEEISGGTSFTLTVNATVTRRPVEEAWQLTLKGFGPLQMFEPVPSTLRASFEPGWECIGPVLPHPEFGSVEIWTDDGTVNTPISSIILADEQARTAAGAHIGMTLGELSAIYSNLRQPYEAGLQGYTEVEFYSTDDNADHDGSLSLYFEVLDGVVVGISLQPSMIYWATSDRICGGP